MAGRSTRSKPKVGTQQQESLSRAKWTTSLTKILVDVMVDKVHEGHKQSKSFSKKGWKCICDEFHKRTGLTWERDQLKSRHIALRKFYGTIKSLLDQSDFEWEEITGLVTATDEAWDKYIKDHPDAETIRSTGCSFYKELCVIFGECGSNGSIMLKDRPSGSHPQSSTLSQEELSNSESEEVPDSNDQEMLQSASSAKSGRKRKLKGVDGAIANAISEMAAASRLRASAMKKINEKYTITECIRALDALEGFNDQLYHAALDLFSNRIAREIFLSLQVGKRLTWLTGKLSGRP